MLNPFYLFVAGLYLADVATAATPNTARPPTHRKPNIVLILADDLGYGDVGCYGQKRIKTPNIDRLAQEGMRFTQFYAGDCVGAPSRATLFTGQDTGHVTIRGNGKGSLAVDDFTLSQMFRTSGYRVDGVGEWELGGAGSAGEPKSKGFNQWVGFLGQKEAENYYPDTLWRYDSMQHLVGREDWNGPVQISGHRYVQDLFSEVMGRVIVMEADYQFFLYLPVTIPHANTALGDKGMQVPHDAPYTGESWPQPEKNKAAMITRLDESVGLLISKLESLHLDKDTMILFTSDNGPHDKGGVDPKFFQSSGPFRGIKGELYEGGLRVPMIVWWPGHVNAGVVSDQVWAMWDIMPTLAGVVGAKSPEGIEGISMLPTWLGQVQTNQHDHLYWESHESGFEQAVRLEDWKGLRAGLRAPVQLYDLKTDLGETNDVAAAHPEVVAQIEKIMRDDRTESPDWPSESSDQKHSSGAQPLETPDLRPSAKVPGAP